MVMREQYVAAAAAVQRHLRALLSLLVLQQRSNCDNSHRQQKAQGNLFS
jgi:hypothetical protein